ncbi:MAG TPA: hypothetical protein VFA29_09430 [Candidatus Baltobacteraceae bacterium]|nr:hypothetical protein [Candidatus Baltobacteraceae bacterium]
MKALITAIIAGIAACAFTGIASAQQYGYPNPYANNGQWYGGQSTIRGTIVAVNGNQVTLRVRGNGARNRNTERDGDRDGDDNNGRYNGDDNNGGYYNNGGYNNGGYNNGNYNNGRYYGRGRMRDVTIDDQPALDNRATGRVAVGRFVTVNGYWRNGVFYAVSMY